jgi:hypothetical protein
MRSQTGLVVSVLCAACAESSPADPPLVDAGDAIDAATPPAAEAGAPTPDAGDAAKPEDAGGGDAVAACPDVRECEPGATQPCGRCGARVCGEACTWGFQCHGETGACEPGATDWSSTGCAASTFHKRTCGATCAWGSESSCADPDTNVMTIAQSAGGVVSAVFAPADGDKGKRPDGICGGALLSPTGGYTRVRVAIANPTTHGASVTIYQSKAPAGAEMDMVMWLYANVDPPTDDASLTACVWGVADECDAYGLGNPCGNTTDHGFAGIQQVAVPAGKRVVVYSAGWGPDVQGPFKLNVRTDGLN